jgi:HPt (histidine-containing phosphotransfer) domain-containing protein
MAQLDAVDFQARLRRADAAIAGLTAAFLTWTAAELDRAEALVAQSQDGRAAPEAAFEAIRIIAHNIKGQGGTFGLPRLSDLAETLCAQLMPPAPRPDFSAVTAKIAAMRAALADRSS